MSQEVGVRNVADLKQFGVDLKRLGEQLAGAFTMAEKKMHVACEGWTDQNNQQFMQEFSRSAKEICKIASQMEEYSKYIIKNCDILEMYQHNRMMR